MRTFSSNPDEQCRSQRPRAVLLAVTDVEGIDDARSLLAETCDLAAPISLCASSVVRAALLDAIDDVPAAPCRDGVRTDGAAVWVTPSDAVTTVDRGRWSVVDRPSIDDDTLLGRLCSSLRNTYRSRVLLITTGTGLDHNPFVRLLVQRGAPFVATRPTTDPTMAEYATVTTIADHLRATVGTIERASA